MPREDRRLDPAGQVEQVPGEDARPDHIDLEHIYVADPRPGAAGTAPAAGSCRSGSRPGRPGCRSAAPTPPPLRGRAAPPPRPNRRRWPAGSARRPARRAPWPGPMPAQARERPDSAWRGSLPVQASGPRGWPPWVVTLAWPGAMPRRTEGHWKRVTNAAAAGWIASPPAAAQPAACVRSKHWGRHAAVLAPDPRGGRHAEDDEGHRLRPSPAGSSCARSRCRRSGRSMR